MRLILTLLLMLGFGTTALAATDSYYIGARDGADLYASPDKDAAVTSHLAWKTYVKVIQKSRNWQQIETTDNNKIRGWVFEGAVRKSYQSSSKSSSGSFFSGFASFFRSPEPAQKTAVLGVRGLDNTDALASGSTAEAERLVEWMDTLRVPDRDVAAFIEDGRLNP